MSAALALLSSLLWGTADFLGGTASRRLDAMQVVLVSQAAALAGLVPLVLVLGPAVEPGLLATGAVAGLIGPLALLAFYRALALGTMGVVAPIAAVGVVVPVVAGLVGGEDPSALQLTGIAAAVVGVVLASGPELRGAGRGGTRPLVLALGASIGFGLVLVLLAEGSDGADTAQVVLVLATMRATSVAILLVSGLVRTGRAAISVARSELPVLAVIGAFDVGANATFAVASQSDLVSVVAVLASLYPAVTAVLAWRLHRERLRPVQLTGVAAALGGVILLSAG